MTVVDIGLSFLAVSGAGLALFYNREAYLAWDSECEMFGRATAAEEELAGIREANSARSRKSAATKRRLKQEAEDAEQPKITALHFEN